MNVSKKQKKRHTKYFLEYIQDLNQWWTSLFSISITIDELGKTTRDKKKKKKKNLKLTLISSHNMMHVMPCPKVTQCDQEEM